MGDLDGDGRAALLDTVADNGLYQRQRARRRAAQFALTTSHPHQVLGELLDQLGLLPAGDESR